MEDWGCHFCLVGLLDGEKSFLSIVTIIMNITTITTMADMAGIIITVGDLADITSDCVILPGMRMEEM